VPQIPALAAEMLDAAAMSRASNSWVIGPARSASGKPILANDPHLNLRAPSLWYLVAIESPTLRVAGGTIPGLPPVVLGHNRRIAWGLTNVEADDVDYVIERLTPDSSRVATPLGMVAVVEVRDTIRVRGAAPVPYTLRRTPNGPLVPRAEIAGPPGDGLVEAVAMRWTGHQPSDELTALLGVNRAGSWTEFLAAVALFRSPEQNWVYADVDGNIGYVTGGAIPVRRSGTGLLPTPGWTGEGSWDRFLDFDELPRAFNPPAGFIVTANNRVVGPEYPWTMSRSWGAPYRAQRIVQLIGDGRSSDAPVTVTDPRSAGPSVRRSPDSFSADDVARMQLDSLDLFAAWAKEIAAAAAERAGFGEQAAALRAWDGSAGTGSAGPTLFWVWYRLLQRYSLEDELGGGVAPSSRLHAWLRAGGSSWFDDVRTPEVEDLAALATRAMREAVPMADGRTWGAAHVTLGRHAMGDVKFLKAVLRLNTGPSPRAGSLYTVNVGEFGWFEPPFVTTHAASMRHVVDMADPDRGLFVVTSGQSGNPLSRRYRNQLPMWLKGDVLTVPLSAGRVEAAGILRLVP
jgi:penicillin amidase